MYVLVQVASENQRGERITTDRLVNFDQVAWIQPRSDGGTLIAPATIGAPFRVTNEYLALATELVGDTD